MQYKVLVIEDSKIDQLIFKRVVKEKKLPYDYTIASSVSEAKQILAQQKFDIILTDHQLGDGTGLEILSLKINAPVIMITGGGNEEIAIQALQLGAYNYLLKDTEQNHLKILPLTIENTLQRWKAEVTSALLSEAMIKIRESVYIINCEDDQIIFVNQAFTETYGYQIEEIIGQTSKLLWAESPCNAIEKNLPCTTGILQERGEYNHKRKDKTEFPVSLSCSQVETNGKTVQVFVTHEITSRKQAEREIQQLNKQLQERSQLLETANQELEKEIKLRKQTEETLKSTLSLQQAILASAGYAIISYTLDGEIITFNKAAENLLGYSAEEVIGQNALTLFHDPQEVSTYITESSKNLEIKSEILGELFCHQLRINHPIKREWTYLRPNQTKVPVLLSVSALRDLQENIIGCLIIASDISKSNYP
ncbi:PAS domain S-box protein [Ancylothrix sp. C2]|uniref:PAS domain-containing response regulator n=1 Tax=Ancylothrix sp. D3o TaxID=2953691 RepID=UPI0021BA729B|nr:PAS domain-containing protein [Ancylothrix sp. D3o]MCT7950562.1 PAS domain S-box protein [Ancylothrix sp. D3o]